MNKPLIIGNWKMHPESASDALRLCEKIKKGASTLRNVSVVVAPPFPFLYPMKSLTRSKSFALGAQDVFWELSGSYTGEVSPSMLSLLGVRFVIVGHSERRALGENDEMVNKKIRATLKVGLTAVLCIGESSRDKSGAYLEFLENQIRLALSKVLVQSLSQIVIAYEPIWAIGEKAERSMKPQEMQESVLYIRKILSHMYGKSSAFSIPVLYGGSVDETNARELLTEGDISGILVGRASRNSEQFIRILDIANELGKKHLKK